MNVNVFSPDSCFDIKVMHLDQYFRSPLILTLQIYTTKTMSASSQLVVPDNLDKESVVAVETVPTVPEITNAINPQVEKKRKLTSKV